jgi:cation transporter-like permease
MDQTEQGSFVRMFDRILHVCLVTVVGSIVAVLFFNVAVSVALMTGQGGRAEVIPVSIIFGVVAGALSGTIIYFRLKRRRRERERSMKSRSP